MGNNIKVDLQEIGLEIVDRVHLVQDKLQWWVFCEHGTIISVSIK